MITEMRRCNSNCAWGVKMLRDDDSSSAVWRSNLTAYSREMLAAALLPWYCQREASGQSKTTPALALNELSRYVSAPLVCAKGNSSSDAASSMARAVLKICEKQSMEARASSLQLIQGLFSLLNTEGHVAQLVVADGRQEQMSLVFSPNFRFRHTSAQAPNSDRFPTPHSDTLHDRSVSSCYT